MVIAIDEGSNMRSNWSTTVFFFLVILAIETSVMQNLHAETPVGIKSWVPNVTAYIETIDSSSNELPADREELLTRAAVELADAYQTTGEINFNFICTHNSRRSHLAQAWALVAAHHFQLEHVHSYSGGTEATACNERIVRSLRRAGFSVVTETPVAPNPVYLMQFAENVEPVKLYSKKYDADANPSNNFFAMMCCSDADEKCPVVVGATGRVALHYRDPKEADNTPEESAIYDERRDQIGAEMFFLVRQIKATLHSRVSSKDT